MPVSHSTKRLFELRFHANALQVKAVLRVVENEFVKARSETDVQGQIRRNGLRAVRDALVLALYDMGVRDA